MSFQSMVNDDCDAPLDFDSKWFIRVRQKGEKVSNFFILFVISYNHIKEHIHSFKIIFRAKIFCHKNLTKSSIFGEVFS